MAAYTWNGSAKDGNYNNPANWTPNGVPGASDTATINTSTASTITVSTNDAVQALTLGKLDTLAISSGETYTVGNAAATSTLSVAGTLSLNSNGYDSDLVVNATSLTLNGAGEILLGNGNDNNRIVAGTAGDLLVNVNDRIVGAGQIGAGGSLGFTNQAGGIVNANASNQLVINTGSLTATNAGIFEATAGGGGLVLQTAVNDGTTGRIAASGAEVFLNGATILGGTLSSTAGFSVQVETNSALDGTANKVTNAGSLVVDSGETLSVLGTLNNTGVLSLQSTGYDSDVAFGVTGTLTSTVTLTGGGQVVLGDANANNRLYGGNANDTLVNLNNTISGSGTIGANQLNLVNDGTISATGTSNALYIQTNAFTNNGLLEAVGSQGLILQSVITDSSTGKLASAGGTIQLNGATIVGGTLSSSGGGSFAVTTQGILQGLTNAGIVEVNSGETLTLLGTIANSGTIGLNSVGYDSDLVVGSPTVTLNGGGTIELAGNNTSDRIYGAVTANTLDNVNNTIEGFGQIGASQLTLINGTAGVIDATGANGLTLETATTVINDGLIEATGAGNLALDSTVNDSGGGTILAASTMIYLNGGDVQGGLLLSTGTGTLSANGQTTLDGSAQAVTVRGMLEVASGDTMTVLGTITNDGTIGLNSVGYDSDLIIGGSLVTLNGGGTIELGGNNTSDRIYGAATVDTLDNVNDVIEGFGQIGASQLTLINGAAGVIDATGANGLTLQTATTVINDGLIEATGAGDLALASTVNDSGGGTILAASAMVYLNGADIQGGVLMSTGTGQLSANGQTTLDGTSQQVSLSGTLEVASGETMTVLGTLNNTGTIGLNSNGYDSDLIVGSPTVTLTGGGLVVLTDNNESNRIYGSSTGNVLNNVNNTIEGSGQLGAGTLTLVNGTAGVIDATGASNQLVISTDAVVTNNGLIESTGAAGLALESTVSNTTGTILAAGSTIYLNSADIQGGLLSSSGTGQLDANGQTTLDGSAHAVTNAGALEVASGSTMTVLGTITNTGTIGLNSTGYDSDLIVGSPTVTLNGGGMIQLAGNNTNDRIYGAATADVLNNVNNTISGFGQIGAGQLTLVNGGTISATGTNSLTINLGSTGMNKAGAALLGVGTGGLSIQNGTYTNAGLIQADDGSSVTFSNGATLTNDNASGQLTGGTYSAMASGNGATLTLAGAALKTDSADLILSGVGSSILFGTTTVESSLDYILAKAQLQILNGRSYTTKLGLTNSGTITLGGGTLTDGLLNDRAGSLLSGFGTVTGRLTSTGGLTATGGTLELTKAATITGLVSGTGTLELSTGHSILNDSNPVTVSAIAMINAATLEIDQPLSYAGTFNIVGASSLTGTGSVSSSGLFEQTGKGVGSIANAFTNTGTISTAAGGTLAFSGGLTNSGLILDKGGFTDTAALTGGTLSVGGKGVTAVLASASGAGNSTLSTLSIGGGTLNTSGTTLTVTGDYLNTAAGSGNSYNPNAGITGTIDGQGTQLSVVGVGGTTIQDVNGTLTIMVTAGKTAHFVVENTGAAGSAALRGALQTTVNGGSINGTALSGSGVTATDFGPIAAGSSGGTFSINYSGGTLNNEAIHLTSDFANVAGVTIDIVAAQSGSAAPAAFAGASMPDLAMPLGLAWGHHG